MAIYTTELRRLIESGFDIGLHDYPIFDESYRDILNQKIINHYYMCEIGAETAGLFKHYLNTKMAEIMPYYNKLYLSERIEFDPMRDFDETTDESRTKTGKTETAGEAHETTATTGATQGTATNTDSTTASSSSLSVSSDTPQGFLNTTDIENNHYATAAEKSEESSTGSSTGSSSTGSQYSDNKSGDAASSSTTDTLVDDVITKHYLGYGKSKAPSELLKLYRETFLNIDMMIINELQDLFMMIF